MTAIATSPTSAKRCRRNRRRARRRGDPTLRGATTWTTNGAAMSCCTSAIPNPRVREAVRQVGREVRDQHDDGEQHRDSHDQQEVSLPDRLREHQPETRPCEHRLRDHCRTYDLGDRQADERDDRDEAVAERMPPQHYGG